MARAKSREVEEPQRLSTSFEDGLCVIQIKLANRTISVKEATYLDGIRRGQIIANELIPVEQEATLTQDEQVRYNLKVNLYCPLIACSDQDIPTYEEFLRMREKDINLWISVARELNPDWFSWITSIEGALTEKSRVDDQKKDKKASG